MSIFSENIVSLSDRRPATAVLQTPGYSADQLLETMFINDVSASEARAIIEADRTAHTTAGATILKFTRRDF